jgi:hypothetical protein
MNGSDWEAALARPGGDGALPSPLATPHPAHARAAEAAAWEAALGGGAAAPPDPAQCVAVVECGSHSTRLLIVDAAGGRDVARMTQDTSLGLQGGGGGGGSSSSGGGSGGDVGGAGSSGSGGGGAGAAGGALPAGSTLRALQEYAAALRRTRPARVRAVGTAALRGAAPAAAVAFLRRAQAVLGHPLEVLSGRADGWGPMQCRRRLWARGAPNVLRPVPPLDARRGGGRAGVCGRDGRPADGAAVPGGRPRRPVNGVCIW